MLYFQIYLLWLYVMTLLILLHRWARHKLMLHWMDRWRWQHLLTIILKLINITNSGCGPWAVIPSISNLRLQALKIVKSGVDLGGWIVKIIRIHKCILVVTSPLCLLMYFIWIVSFLDYVWHVLLRPQVTLVRIFWLCLWTMTAHRLLPTLRIIHHLRECRY